MSLYMQAQLRHTQLNLLCHAWARWHLGRVTTYSSLSLTHALPTAVAAAAEFCDTAARRGAGNCAAAAS